MNINSYVDVIVGFPIMIGDIDGDWTRNDEEEDITMDTRWTDRVKKGWQRGMSLD